MIIECPACAARFWLDQQRLSGKRVTVRCARCQHVFQKQILKFIPAKSQTKVIVAHTDQALCLAIGDILTCGDMAWQSCHDGPNALKCLSSWVPQVAIVDVALAGLFSFELIARIRQDPRLASIKIILLSSVYNRTAYKRTPNSLYGADDYIEKHHLVDCLIGKIRALVDPFGQVVASSRVVQHGVKNFKGRQGQSFREITRNRVLIAEAGGTAFADKHAMEKGNHLAKMIVSDIALYYQELIDEGIRTGRVWSLLAEQIMEGQRHFDQRAPAEIRGRRDLLRQALNHLIERRRKDLQS